MKNLYLSILLFGCASANIVFADNGEQNISGERLSSETSFKSAVVNSEKNWPKDVEKYCLNYKSIINEIDVRLGHNPEAFRSGEINNALQSLFEKAETEPSSSCSLLLNTQRDGMNSMLRVAMSPSTSPQDRFYAANVAISFYKNLYGRFVANATWKKVYLNIAPPIGGSNTSMAAGMDPNEISNPEVKKQYEAAIRQNALNSMINAQRRTGESILPEIKVAIIALLRDTSKRHPETKDQAEALLGVVEAGATVDSIPTPAH
jgi:hypothetical protein